MAIDFLDQMLRFLDPISFTAVFGGAVLAAALRSTREDMGRAIAALRPLFASDPQADARAAMQAVRAIEKIAEVRHIMCVDRVETAGRFLRRAAFRLSDAENPRAFALWVNEESEELARRHDGAIGVWRAIADAAPAMGMIGTVIGLVRMFASMDDPAAVGPAMALALLATFYGILLANVIAGPIAARLERLSEAERGWRGQALRRLEALAATELEEPPARSRPHLRKVS